MIRITVAIVILALTHSMVYIIRTIFQPACWARQMASRKTLGGVGVAHTHHVSNLYGRTLTSTMLILYIRYPACGHAAESP